MGQDHEYFIRDQKRKEEKGDDPLPGRSGLGVRPVDKPTTWGDLGIDPANDPYWVRKYQEEVTCKIQGMDVDGALVKEAERKGIGFNAVRRS